MKTKQLNLAIATVAGAAAIAVAPSAFSFSYSDSADFNPSGRVIQENHAFFQDQANAPYCIGGCVDGGNAESQWVMRISNDPIYGGSGGPSATPVEDNLAMQKDSSGNALNGEFVFFTTSNTIVDGNSWQGTDFMALIGLTLNDFAVTTDPSGKIISGWFQQFTDAFGTIGCGLYDMDARLSYAFEPSAGTSGDPCSVTIDHVRGLTNGVAGYADPVNNNTNGWPADVDIIGVTVHNYVTCDTTGDCAQSGSAKAVPVPAFAAAALGLGLAGVTMLTGRRRKLK